MSPQTTNPPATREMPSDQWWLAIAQCESGNTDAWRTGYFGLEGGPGVVLGGRGWDAELADAKAIYAAYGPGAWGCAPVADRAVGR